jgi:chitin disaccharide deacetylase
MKQPARKLLIHADDFGMCGSVNAAIAEAFDTGVIDAAAIMVPCPASEEAIQLSLSHPEWDVGVHLTFTSEWDGLRWGPVAPPAAVPSLVDQDGYFWKDISLFTAHAVPAEIEVELDAQLRRVYDFGLQPTHIDCHMYSLFRSGPLFRVYERASDRWRLPALGRRMPSAPEKIFTLTESAQIKNFANLYLKMISRDWEGIAQLTTHPGHNTPELRAITKDAGPWGAEWREADLAAISTGDFQGALAAGICRIGWQS